ncbi:MAG: sulfite exporter TauE/SafE family protein [Bacteroidota bacterium]
MAWLEVVILIVSGILVGFINTLAGGGTIISLSALILLGLPANIANGTNRIAVTIQTLTSVAVFRHHHVLDTKKGLRLGIPVIIGSVLGAEIATTIAEEVFEKVIGVIILFMMVFVIYKPEKWLKGQIHLQNRKVTVWQYILFFVMGIYGGFLHVGIGYFLLASLVLGAGYDLVKANAVKVLIVLMYAPFTLLVFMLHNEVNYKYGLILAIGNVLGALTASKLSIKRGAGFVRWVMVVVILVFSFHLLEIIDVKSLIGSDF